MKLSHVRDEISLPYICATLMFKGHGVGTPQLDLCANLWAEAVHSLPNGSDNTAIFRFIQERLQSANEQN
ncbi:hypothetical protein M8994_20050 [Brucella sp. 21LCYQ03]|nr:hypothetical protein [Brucella sp. 21LCYQ03]